MDITENKAVYPRWIGIVLGFLVPGSAHFFSGHKKAGLIWYFGLMLLPRAGGLLMTLPSKTAISCGFVLILCVLFFTLAMLISSFRHVERLGRKPWLVLAGIMIFTLLVPDAVRFYKMPASSMQPTLRGITVQQTTNDTSFAAGLIRGTVFEEIIVKTPGSIEGIPKRTSQGMVITIAAEEYLLPNHAMLVFGLQKEYKTGDVLWSGTVTAQDHLVVNPYAYCIQPPARGDIVIFETSGINHRHVNKDTVYTKRIAGLPGETIRIDPPHIIINGRTIRKSVIFRETAYANEGLLANSTNSITLSEGEYFVLGDNPEGSFDSRYFGAITKESIRGRVCSIYWPISRIGSVD
jgi:signal peptidase I